MSTKDTEPEEQEDKKIEDNVKETDPALPKDVPKSKDQITDVIGEVGKWQLEKILIVFLASAPGKIIIQHPAIKI